MAVDGRIQIIITKNSEGSIQTVWKVEGKMQIQDITFGLDKVKEGFMAKAGEMRPGGFAPRDLNAET